MNLDPQFARMVTSAAAAAIVVVPLNLCDLPLPNSPRSDNASVGSSNGFDDFGLEPSDGLCTAGDLLGIASKQLAAKSLLFGKK